VPLPVFLENRFGRYYDGTPATHLAPANFQHITEAIDGNE
jgi:hypothetical protein